MSATVHNIRTGQSADAASLNAALPEREAIRIPFVELKAGQYKQATELLPTFREYMQLALYHPEIGYYSAGKVAFGKDFTTFPIQLSPYFGGLLAEHAFKMWRCMKQRGVCSELEPFKVSEFGCGEGLLARDFCRTVEVHSQSDPEWQMFRYVLRYQAIEQSLPLCHRIDRNLSGLSVARGVIQSDAVSFVRRKDFNLGKGVVISNELIDAFPVEIFKLRDGIPHVLHVVPLIQITAFASCPDLRKVAEDADRRVRSQLRFVSWQGNGSLFLDYAGFQKLLDACGKFDPAVKIKILAGFHFIETSIPLEGHPKIRSTVAGYVGVAHGRPGFCAAVLPPDAVDYFSGIRKKLCAGYVISIDYGGLFNSLQRRLEQDAAEVRTYGDNGKKHSPYEMFSVLDLTSNVDFTFLKWVGKRYGLDTIHFGPQSSLLAGTPPSYQIGLRSMRDKQAAVKFAEENTFKMLVQATRDLSIQAGWPL